ncbi:MAG: T9SS type A sorting domain-containing protein [Bacteroidota bacterium]
MQRSSWILLVLLLLPYTAFAQTGTCEPTLSQATLNVGNVRANIYNDGALFRSFNPNPPYSRIRYHVPKGDSINIFVNASFWVGGKIDNEIRTAATRYGPQEFWAGPLDENGNPPASCAQYDKLWEISKADIESFLHAGEVSENLKNWPWHLGAPVVDGDGNTNNYNLAKGDLPELLGDQRIWWIMNDRGNTHRASKSNPLGIEIHASAFAFIDHRLENFTFYSYKLINKNSSSIEDAYVSLFTEGDLGNYSDDFLGSDSLLHLGYHYNGDNDDQGDYGYGKAPPAFGVTFLHTQVADADNLDNDRDMVVDEPGEMLGTSGTLHYYFDTGPYGDPVSARHYYNYMRSRWGDGSPVLEGLTGFPGSHWPASLPQKPTNFFYTGDPTIGAFWSEVNSDAMDNAALGPGDRRFIISSGPFNLSSGDTTTVNFAIIWSRGESNLDSVSLLKRHTTGVRAFADQIFTPVKIPEPAQTFQQQVLGFDQNFPNPFTESTTLRYSLPQTMQVRLAVYDLLGREVAILVDAQQDAGIHTAEFDAGDLPAGIYLARIELDFLRFTKRMVLIR